jgi:hypothetical protein
MARNATMSQDGAYRLDLRIPVRIPIIAAASAIAMISCENAETISKAGRARLLAWCRDGIESYGLDHIYMAEADDYLDERAAAAKRLVELGVFPPEALPMEA